MHFIHNAPGLRHGGVRCRGGVCRAGRGSRTVPPTGPGTGRKAWIAVEQHGFPSSKSLSKSLRASYRNGAGFCCCPLGAVIRPWRADSAKKAQSGSGLPPPGTAGKGRLPPPQYMRLRPVGFGEGNHLFCPGPVAICRRVKYNQRGETSRQERGILGNGQKGICAAKAPGMAG